MYCCIIGVLIGFEVMEMCHWRFVPKSHARGHIIHVQRKNCLAIWKYIFHNIRSKKENSHFSK